MSECLLYERNLCWLHHILLVACSWIHVSWKSQSHLQLNHEIWALSEILRRPFFQEKRFFFFNKRVLQIETVPGRTSSLISLPEKAQTRSFMITSLSPGPAWIFGSVFQTNGRCHPTSMLKLLYLVLLHAEEHQLCFWLCPNIPPPPQKNRFELHLFKISFIKSKPEAHDHRWELECGADRNLSLPARLLFQL